MFDPEFTVDPEEMPCGLAEVFHPNGILKYRGEFEEGGIRIGLHIEYWENGNVRELSYWHEGWIVGTCLRFNENGIRDEEEDFGETGSREGCVFRRTYSPIDGAAKQVKEVTPEGVKSIWIAERYKGIIDPARDQKRIDDAVREWKIKTGRLKDDQEPWPLQNDQEP